MTYKLEKISKIAIDPADGLDAIRVYIENYNVGRGRITINIFDSVWSCYWGNMGGADVEHFLNMVSTDYIIGCLAPGLDRKVKDMEGFPEFTRKYIDQQLAEGEFTQAEADRLLADVDLAGVYTARFNEDYLRSVYGDEWSTFIPDRINPAYAYIEKVVNSVRKVALEAFPKN